MIKDSSKSLLYSTHLTWKSNQPTKMLGAKGRQSVDEHLFSPVSPGPFFLTKETQEDISNSSPFGFMSPPKALLRDASHVHGGRHRPRMNSRGSSPEKKNDVELRLEVSEFIKHADSLTGDSEDKDKSSERSSTGGSCSSVTHSLIYLYRYNNEDSNSSNLDFRNRERFVRLIVRLIACANWLDVDKNSASYSLFYEAHVHATQTGTSVSKDEFPHNVDESRVH